MFDYENFRVKLREHRCSLSLTIEQLAEKAEIDYSTLSKIENSVQKPTITTVISILNAFNTNITEFFGVSEDEKALLINLIIQTIQNIDFRDKKLFLEIIKQYGDKYGIW